VGPAGAQTPSQPDAVVRSRLVPDFTTDEAYFWQSGLAGRLEICRCQSCGLYLHPWYPVCRSCRGRDVRPEPVSGRAHVYSFTVNQHDWGEELSGDYVLAIVELVEQTGLYLATNIVGCPSQDVVIGMPVAVTFEVHGDAAIPLFEPHHD
jgi:uncharacterized protein